MYYCKLRLYFIGNQRQIFKDLKKISPLEHFTHEFAESDIPEKSLASESDILLADISNMDAIKTVRSLIAWKKPKAELIILADKSQIVNLTDVMSEITDIWTLPMSDNELHFRYRRWQRLYKERVDHWQTKHFLETTINSVPNLIWYKDKNGIHEKVNDSFCQVVGKTKAQVEGKGHAYIWDVEQDDPACIESERIVMEKKETCVSEETIQTGEGTKLLTTYKSPLYNWDGNVMGTVGVAIDVTREHAYAKELIKKNQTLETLFTTMDCGVMCHSLDGSQIISINRAALRILGYDSQEELMADGFNMIATSVLDEDKEKVRNKINSLKKVGDNASAEYRVCHKDGTVLHVLGNIKLVEENGELFYQRYLLDFTAQKMREETQRREDERRQMELLHALSIEYDLVCYFDLDTGEGQVLRIDKCENSALRSIFTGTLSLEKCMEQYITAEVHTDDKEILRKAVSPEQLSLELLDKKLFSINFRTIDSDEIHYFQLKAVRAGEWSNNRGVVLGLCSVDKETRNEMEKRAALEDALVQANQANKAKSTFLSNMSHDIRTPMNAIIGFTTLAIQNVENKELVQSYLNKINTSGKHLLSLINDVLDMSHIESGKIYLDEKPCNLSDIMCELRNIIQADADQKQLDIYIDSTDIRHDEIYCDILRLNQILLNLLNNAVKYTEPGGMISLKVIEKKGDYNDFSNYEFHIRDTGIGMSEEFVKHIFEPFERERNSTVSGISGTGLGMAITKNIVDMMHGTIEVKSRKGIGTECVVSLTLRLNSEFNKNETSKCVNRTNIPIRTGHILLVEDNELNQEIALTILEDAGFTAEVAENGRTAVDMLQNSEPGYYQLILMDIQMPVMNGYEATSAIRNLSNKELSEIPIIAMTANAFEEDKQKALRCGMDGHIAKPIDVEKLLNTLDDIFSQYDKG